MPNPNPKVQALRTDKRFEALLKQEMIEHQAIISSHHKEMQTLRDSLTLSTDKYYSLYQRCEENIQDLSFEINKNLLILKEKMIANQVLIEEQKKTILSLSQQLNDIKSLYVSKIDLEKFIKEIKITIQDTTTNHLNSFQNCEREFKYSFKELERDHVQFRCDMEQKLCELHDKTESQFNCSRLDKEGVLKAVRMWEKTIFIIEKKIENIYTLIDRINQKGSVCHKQE